MAASMALSLSSCDMLSGVIGSGDEPESETVSYSCGSDGDTFTITLPSEMKSSSFYMSQKAASDKYLMQLYPTGFSTITPNEGHDFPTLIEFVSAIYLKEGESVETDGTYNYIDRSVEKGIVYYFFFESENSFWTINFQADPKKVSKEEALETFKAWASTVTIKNAESAEKSE